MKRSYWFLLTSGLIALTVLGWLMFYQVGDDCRDVYSSSRNLVPDSKTAIKIAEAVLIPFFGEGVRSHKPFRAELKDSVWWVRGKVTTPGMGGSPVVVIEMKNARVLDIYHEK